jgi:hypothetical protein
MSNEIPSQFKGGPESDPHIVRAFAYLGNKIPTKIRTAFQKAREAEWAWKKGSSLDLTAQVVSYKNHLNERIRHADGDMTDKAVLSAMRLLADAQALLDAVPEEAERLNALREFQEHKRELESAKATIIRMEAEFRTTGKKVTIDDRRAFKALRVRGAEDDLARRKALKRKEALRDAAEAALDNLKVLLVEALIEVLDESAKSAAKAIGTDAEHYAEDLTLLMEDVPEFTRALMEAKTIQSLARSLGAELDLVVAFQNPFSKKNTIARDLVERAILGNSIKLGNRDQKSGDSGILDLEL